MRRQVNIYDQTISCDIHRSRRAKRLRLTVYCDGDFVVTVPKKFALKDLDKYILAKSKWVINKLDFFRKLNERQKLVLGNDNYESHKVKAEEMIRRRLNFLNKKFYDFEFKKVVVKNQKTRWGSCSKKGNLNFNYKVLFLEPRMRDYVLAHELCHLKEFNHSNKFWRLVSQSIPNHLSIREQINTIGLDIR